MSFSLMSIVLTFIDFNRNHNSFFRFDLTPKNMNIAVYCRSLINVNFTGQSSSPDDQDSCRSLVPPTAVSDEANLAEALRGIDELLRSVDNDFSGHEEEFRYYLQACIEERDPSKGNDQLYRMKFIQDAKQFVRIYKNRQCKSSSACFAMWVIFILFCNVSHLHLYLQCESSSACFAM